MTTMRTWLPIVAILAAEIAGMCLLQILRRRRP